MMFGCRDAVCWGRSLRALVNARAFGMTPSLLE